MTTTDSDMRQDRWLMNLSQAYGVEFPDKIEFNTPFKESLPRIAQPYYEHIFYYAQYDALAKLAGGKKWRFVEVRPDAIVCLLAR
jgi:hypothetical protein